MASRVYVTRRVPDGIRRELEATFDTRFHDELDAPPRTELLAAVAGAEGLVTVPVDRVDGELLDATGPQLRIVAQYGVGYDNVDLDAARERGVVVTNTPDVLTRASAELTIALILALLRRVAEGDRVIRRGEQWSLSPTFMLGAELHGRTLGIVGLGRIGHEVARLATAHGMHVIHTSRSSGLPLERLLAEADVVSLHTPLTPETRRLIDDRALSLMRPDAYLVNTSRGAVVDEDALVRALAERRIAGAALDVFEHEPEVPPALLQLQNVVLTPHVASATLEAREAMGLLCVEALRDVLVDGRTPRYAVA